MVNSGHHFADGSIAFPNVSTSKYYDAYKSMVEAELRRPPEAEVDAFSERVGNHLEFTIWVTNRSDKTLLAWDNGATVNAIVYEDKRVILTNRFVRAAADESISSELPPGETAVFTLETSELSGVIWDNLHAVTFVDYRPGDGAYDMLQAAVAVPPDFVVQPSDLVFLIDPAVPGSPSAQMRLRGLLDLQWSAEESLTWLTVSPDEGPILNSPTVTVNPNELSPGWQSGVVDFTAGSVGGPNFARQVTVQAYFGEVEQIFLPLVTR